jgi:GNAT superfamily N-acetyltransferase
LTETNETFVTIAERPDLVPVVAGWLWDAFWQKDGHTLKQTEAAVADWTSSSGPPQGFVLLVDGEAVGTASLVAHDLDQRRDLTPWLANVFVKPEARRRGHVGKLVAAVEEACRAASISPVWLYTHTAEHLYAKAGWRTVEYFDHAGQRNALMRRDL